jgi:UDP-glucuronate 4-epimerase
MDEMERIFALAKPSHVIHLAAQAGIRYSMEHPESYIESNMLGFFNVIETSRKNGVEHFLYASSSSVYGKSQKVPYFEDDRTDEPISLYAATKKSNELMAHVYSHLYKLPTTGMRFFTVYGPWGRPDMAYFKFTQSLYTSQTIDLYHSGQMQRDFTYIDDVKEAIGKLMLIEPLGDTPYAIYNIGRTQPEELLGLVEMLEAKTGLKAKLRMMPMQAGEVLVTMADTAKLESTIGFSPSTSLSDGLDHFLEWFRNYHQIV